jgi:hypothetical protein
VNNMNFKEWINSKSLRTVVCKHADAAKYVVNNMLTPGKEYEVKNETDEFVFIIDNSGKVGGYYKTYFE